MTDLVVLGLLGLGLGVGYTLSMRQLTQQLVLRPNIALSLTMSLTISMVLARMVPMGTLVAVGLAWGVGPALAAFGGFWLGRTLVLVLSFSHKLE